MPRAQHCLPPPGVRVSPLVYSASGEQCMSPRTGSSEYVPSPSQHNFDGLSPRTRGGWWFTLNLPRAVPSGRIGCSDLDLDSRVVLRRFGNGARKLLRHPVLDAPRRPPQKALCAVTASRADHPRTDSVSSALRQRRRLQRVCVRTARGACTATSRVSAQI